MEFGRIEIDMKGLERNFENISEMIKIGSACLNRQGLLQKQTTINREDLIRKLRKNIFQQETKFLFLFLRENWDSKESLGYNPYIRSGSKFLVKNERRDNLCHLSSQKILLTLNTIKE